MAAGLDAKSEMTSNADKNVDEGGTLILNETDKTNIKSSIKQNTDLLNKFHAFQPYQFELGYDLAIVPTSNVSESFGFESFVGLFRANE